VVRSTATRYVVISHSVAYTAQGVAALTHISGKELAKSVIVKIDGALAMAVLPASLHIDLSLLRSAAGANRSHLLRRKSSESGFQTVRPEPCLPSAIFTICRSLLMKA
jgi:Ala-tRNA(Pro) deacylase